MLNMHLSHSGITSGPGCISSGPGKLIVEVSGTCGVQWSTSGATENDRFFISLLQNNLLDDSSFRNSYDYHSDWTSFQHYFEEARKGVLP